MSDDLPKLPEPLEKIIDKVLAYKPKPRTKAANKRKKAAKRRQVAKPDTRSAS
jgi:hypothetical protein